MFRCIFKSGHMADCLGSLYGVVMLCNGYLHYYATFCFFPTSVISYIYTGGVSALIVPIFIFDIFPGSECNC